MNKSTVIDVRFTKRTTMLMACCMIDSYTRYEIPKDVLIKVMTTLAGEGPAFFSERSKRIIRASVVQPNSRRFFVGRYYYNFYTDGVIKKFINRDIDKYDLMKSFSLAMNHDIDVVDMFRLSQTTGVMFDYRNKFLPVMQTIVMSEGAIKVKFLAQTKKDTITSILRKV